MTAFHFTNVNISSKAPPPQNGKAFIEYSDDTDKNLKLYVTSSGSKTFYFRKKINGKYIRKKIGDAKYMSVSAAREKARKLAALDSSAFDKPKSVSIQELIDQYINNHSKKKNRRWKDEEHDLKRFLKSWMKRSASSISRQDIEKLHNKIGNENGHYQANRLLAKVSSMFNYAINLELIDLVKNPCKGIDKFSEQSRSRVLSKEELTAFFNALFEEEDKFIQAFFIFSLYTGARRGCILQMEWNEIDFENKSWIIPGSKMKSKRETVLHLPDEVMERLQTLPHGDNDNPYVFFSPTSKSGHIDAPRNALKRILKKANLKNVRFHDFRRTFASIQADIGASMILISRSLGQLTTSATHVYTRVSSGAVADSVNEAAKAISKQMQKTKENKKTD